MAAIGHHVPKATRRSVPPNDGVEKYVSWLHRAVNDLE